MKIAFTGGGTAGHAVVNTVLIPYLQKKECHIIYIGSHNGMEKAMLEQMDSVKYFGISTGKLRRYPSLQNLADMFRILKGFTEAYRILRTERPHVLYSGGGYVSVPAVFAAKCLRIPVLIRETDYTIGLANRLCIPFAQTVYTAFPDTQAAVKNHRSIYPGMLIRPALYNQSLFPAIPSGRGKPLCLILGGSTGAKKINEVIWSSISTLSERYDIIHICGKGNLNPHISDTVAYRQFEYVHERIGDFLNAADVVVTRCGSNAILETMALGKKTVCIPITTRSSRGEQSQNAFFAAAHGNAVLLEEENLNENSLCSSIEKALRLDHDMPFQTTRTKLQDNIDAHISEIWEVGYKKMADDFLRSATENIVIKFDELSGWEFNLFDEIVSECKEVY